MEAATSVVFVAAVGGQFQFTATYRGCCIEGHALWCGLGAYGCCQHQVAEALVDVLYTEVCAYAFLMLCWCSGCRTGDATR